MAGGGRERAPESLRRSVRLDVVLVREAAVVVQVRDPEGVPAAQTQQLGQREQYLVRPARQAERAMDVVVRARGVGEEHHGG